MEQWTRRGSIRVQGLRQTGPGTLEDKLIALFNNDLAIQPPIQLQEIEVAHRLPNGRGQPVKEPPPAAPEAPPGDVTGTTPNSDINETARQPQTVIINFLSRHTKAVVMNKDAKKSLKGVDMMNYPFLVFFNDDLTARRAKIAFEARQFKGWGLIKDTWVSNSKIIIKDLHNHIHAVTTPTGISKFKQ